ncbi:hypothetical protein CI109_106915 [Kwoniella shandongensis]|uniref:Autophagy-related protein 4 n=1 Tax=Kwoniella shandongensis TaxID=1734106 RepID=A0A5M6C7I5_9TREE|nr:uncharacterized protein CI109_000830 [Kwoniella shandongensis]KAA5530650.1 hypothetical protein CI109_000830 [Kwoniella shandongensis]
MAAPTSTSDPTSSSPIIQSPTSTTSVHSQSSSSSHPHLPPQTARLHPNLPPPPPADRVPPSKGRSQGQSTQHQKFKLLRKGKEKDQRSGSNEVDEEWTLEGGGGGTSNGHGAMNGMKGDAASIARSLSPDSRQSYDSQMMEVLTSKDEVEKKEKRSKGRGLVKKTSRLFSRDKSGDRDGEHSGSATPSLGPGSGSRQASYSSTTSSESQSTTSGSIRNHFPSLNRPPSNQSRTHSHSRRASQDSQTSWQAPPPRSVRSGSSSYDSPNDVGVPIPQRQGSQLGASVPGLSRNALPQPGPSQIPSSGPRSVDTFPTRMSTWFSHLLPSASTSTITEGTSSSSSESPNQHPPSPVRKPASAAASFLNAARQRAVDGVRHLLDTEAQPDKCQDNIWVMGVEHPGWRPSTPVKSPPDGTTFLPDMADGSEILEDRRGSGSSGRPSPPSKSDSAGSGSLRPAAWSRKQKESQASIPVNTSASPPPAKGFSTIFTASNLSLALPSSVGGGSPSKDGTGTNGMESPSKGRKDKKDKEVLRWPDQFYDDFRSRVWCTYRGQYAPILSLPNSLLIPSPDTYFSAFASPGDLSANPTLSPTSMSTSLPSRPSAAGWSWSKSAEERGLTSDAGWGCMLRTGQSMLANALIHLHLGRDWRVPPQRPSTEPMSKSELAELESYGEYVRIMTWFLDDPSPLCPFSVHRMALIGKELGKEVGEWFGPSTAAGALKTLANSFALGGLAVATATDSIIYKSDVYVASNLPSDGWIGDGNVPKPRRSSTTKYSSWGDKAVLILVGIRLGLDGVNPIYYESIKALFTFPQSVGIAGGRPSSSYYFVGSQANSLFYLDPHLTRPAVPLEVPPVPTRNAAAEVPDSADEEAVMIDTPQPSASVSAGASGRSSPVQISYTLDVVDVDDVESEDSEASLGSSPSHRLRSRKVKDKRVANGTSVPTAITPPRSGSSQSASNSTSMSQPDQTSLVDESPETPHAHASSFVQSLNSDPFELSPSPTPRAAPAHQRTRMPQPVNPETLWYANAYSENQLRTFHCEKVKKMPLSGLDPSMLLGFLCRDEKDFEDFCERVAKLPQKIFTVQDEPPTWDEDDDAGLESVSEPDLSASSSSHGDVPVQRESGIPPPDSLAGYQDVEENGPVSANTTVAAVDIVRGTRKLELDGGEGEEGGDDDSWIGTTPASQKPVLVGKLANEVGTTMSSAATTSRPGTEMEVPVGQEGTSASHAIVTGGVGIEATGRSGEEEKVSPSKYKGKYPSAHLPVRTRTESWVNPSRGGEEAPNGDSLL